MLSITARWSVLWALTFILLSGGLPAAEEAATPSEASLAGMKISFKSELWTKQGKSGRYRWVSQSVLVSTRPGRLCTVDIAAQGVNPKGKLVEITPRWTPSDTDMVTVSSAEGRRVTITVRHAGESSLAVDCQGLSKKLLIKAWQRDNVVQVQISQSGAAPMSTALASVRTQEASRPTPPAAALPSIKVVYKLDPRVTRGMYMGDRWVSPATYTAVQAGNEATVEAMARLADRKGALADISPKWTASNPDMVAVSPGQGHQVKMTVRLLGESLVNVEYGGLTKTLVVKAAKRDGAMHVDVIQ